MEKIAFETEDGQQEWFYVLEQAKLSGNTYILVTDTEEGDGEALILKEVSLGSKKEVTYEEVTDEGELGALSSLFGNLLEDCVIE
ncbi:MAG: DUF1292 domain-containing protein [Lachnospiraceae bacterium]|nr:DUF1292 domain-containing protein [Lachnospiraceae bacterium]